MTASVWRFTDDDGVEREISTVDLRAALMKGTLLPSTLVWREGMKEWVPAFTLPDLASAAIAAARVDRSKPGPPSVPPGVPVQKNRPTQTLQGIDPASLGNEAAAALAKIRGVAPPAPERPNEPFGRASAPEDATLDEAVKRIIAPAADPLAPRVVKTQPTGSLGTAIAATDIIPKAPKLPNLDGANRESRPKSIPPPLPPRSKTPEPSAVAPAVAATPSPPGARPPLPRKQTLMGMSAAIPMAPVAPGGPRSRPPPPPRRGPHPSVPPAAAPPAPAQTPKPPTIAERERPKPPLKRSVRPPAPIDPALAPQLTPTELAATPGIPGPNGSMVSGPAAARPIERIEERPVGQITATLGTVSPTSVDAKPTSTQSPSPHTASTHTASTPRSAQAPAQHAQTATPGSARMANLAEEATDQLSNSQILGARELLASIHDTPEDENTVTLTKNMSDIVKEVRAPQPRPSAKVPKRVQIAQEQAAAAAAAAATQPAALAKSAAAAASAAPTATSPVGETTQPIPIVAEAKVDASSAKADPGPAKEPAPLVRQRTMEMSLTDHQDAAASQPIPASQRPDHVKKPLPIPPDPTTEPLPDASATVASASVAPVTSAAKDKDRDKDKPGAARVATGGAERLSRPERASLTNEDGEDGEYKILRRMSPPVEVPRRSIVGASLLWMVGLVIFFFVGRCAGYSRAAQFVDMRSGAGRSFLAWSAGDTSAAAPVSSAPEEVKPCWVARQPTKWAPSATKYVPISMEPIEGSMSFGFGLDETEAAGIVVEPKSGKFEQKFNQKLDAKEKAKISRVVPMPSREGGYFISKKGERDWMPILGADPFFLAFTKESVGWADSDEKEPAQIFSLPGEGDVSSQRVLDEGTSGYFVSFLKGNVVLGGYFDKQKNGIGALSPIPGSSETAKQGKPKSGFNGEETAVIFAERADPKAGPWTVRLGHAKAGTVPTTTEVLTFPDGGPGGDVFAPDIVGLPDGRWLVMWTEGDEKSAIRALTYSKDFQPIGDPIALSPPGDFGQAVLGNAAGYTIVAFFQRNAQGDFELWGAVLKCG